MMQTGFDHESLAELRAPHDRITDPWRAAAATAGRALLLLTIPAAGYLIRFHRHLETANWAALALIPIGIGLACVAYAFLGARFGRRTARRTIVWPLAAGLVAGVYALVQYMERR